jgi:hypothetical protein
VLSRLLVKSLGDDAKVGDGTDEVATAELKRKLGSLRKRLLRSVEKTMDNLDGDREELVQALCAYSLATSSGAKDVLRHFLHMRGEAMATSLEIEEEGAVHKEIKQESIIRALGLYAKTLVDVQALVPRRLSDALLELKGRHLLKDEGVRELDELRLDICERWFGDEITYFTPYIRHDDLDGPQAVATLKGWSKKASEVLLDGVEKVLEAVTDFKVVVELRTKVFEMWVAEGGKAKGFDSSMMLDGLRKVVNQRLVDLLEARVAKLHLVDTEVEAALEAITSGVVPRQSGLWDNELLDMELTRGAAAFKQAIVDHVHGRNNSVSRVVKCYQTWKHLIDEMATEIEQLKSQKWNDDLDSLEDEEVLEERQKSLSKDDPEMLQARLRNSLEQAFKTLNHKLEALSTKHAKNERIGEITVFILRILRDLRADLPKQPDIASFGLSLVPKLHEALALVVSSETIPAYTSALSSQKHVPGRALWEGSPELPIYPSPSTFRFLHETSSAMADVGSDLWSQGAVGVLKKHICEELVKNISEALNSQKGTDAPPKTNGHESGEEKTLNGEEASETSPKDDTLKIADVDVAVAKDMMIQTLFNTIVLRLCLTIPAASNSADKLVELEKSLKEQADLEPSSNERLLKAAQEYYKRTSLLLGPLA